MRRPKQLVFSTKKVAARRDRERAAADDAAAARTPATEAPTPSLEDAAASSTDSIGSGSSSGASGRPHGSRGSRRTPSPPSRRASSQLRSERRDSVKRLRPSRALLQGDHISVAQCVRAMVEKQTDAALLMDKNGLLTGILTDRDVAFKVVAVGKSPRLTRVSDVMTPNPSCVSVHASAIDALKQMISGQFRHLPVADNEKVVGILDIAKCLYEAISKLEHAYEVSSKRLEESVKKLQRRLSGVAGDNLFETLREKLFLPTLSAILTEGSDVPIMDPSATALEAAQLMLEKKRSAVMVCEGARVVGIFTTKDLMRRVVAMDLDPSTCLLSRVMTQNPHSATLSTTILETLHSMHNGRFLHVPVFDADGKLVGLVDVLQVTCGVVQQMGSFQSVKNDSVQPLWDQFRSSLVRTDEGADGDDLDDTQSDVDSSHRYSEPAQSDTLSRTVESVLESRTWRDFQEAQQRAGGVTGGVVADADPVHGDGPVMDDPTPDVFVYKLADCYGNNHRFTSSAESLKELLQDVQTRLGDHTIRRVHYVDDEGDHVLLFKDDDLKDAVNRARMWGNKYIRLIVPHRMTNRRDRDRMAVRHAFAHSASATETSLGIVYYAAAAAAIAGASFLLSRRK